MRYVVHITTLQEPIRFFARGTTREAARAEALDFIRRWPLQARNQPCGFRIEESHWPSPGPPPSEPSLPKGGNGEPAPAGPDAPAPGDPPDRSAVL